MFAFLFESVGGGEWLVLLAVILIVVGPKNLPSAARKMGKVMSQLRRAADEFKRQIMSMDEEIKKVGDDLKKEYVDIPDASNPAEDPAANDVPSPEEYGSPYPGNMDAADYEAYGMDRAEDAYGGTSSGATADAGDSVRNAEADSPARSDAASDVAAVGPTPENAGIKITVSPLKPAGGTSA